MEGNRWKEEEMKYFRLAADKIGISAVPSNKVVDLVIIIAIITIISFVFSYCCAAAAITTRSMSPRR